MKTKFFLISLVLFASISANAQFKKYSFGLKAAPQVSWMKPNTDSYEGNGAKMAFSWGFVSEIGFSENHCLATGFNVVFNGGNLKFPSILGENNGTMSRSYYVKSIELPLTLKMRTNSIGNMKYYGQIGFGTSFRFGAKKTDEFTYNNSTITEEKENYDNISFLRESLIIGLGGEYTLDAGTTFSVGLALNNGFTDMLSGKNPINSEKEKATLNFVELSVAVLF
ncbi:MAG: PorT family protein [Bacteroidales bacterium]|nr:PorT family protein [Bacteroidales bacterium]